MLASEAGASRHWRWLGLFGAFTVFCILSFYSVVSGWSIEFLVASVNGNFNGASAAEIGAGFEAFLANPGLLIFNHSLFLFMTMTVVAAGVAKGLERLNNLLMPLLYGLLLLLAIYATTTSGFGTALSWLFLPSFEDVTAEVVLHAMGHAFFTLAVGACALMAYGAYMPDEQSLPKAAFAVAVLDISVALLAGIAIFSVVFAQGMDPADGPGLMFVTLPIAFSELPWGSFWLSVFSCCCCWPPGPRRSTLPSRWWPRCRGWAGGAVSRPPWWRSVSGFWAYYRHSRSRRWPSLGRCSGVTCSNW